MLAWPSVKLLLLNAASCIVSLNRHGPAANPGAGHVGGARVVVLERGADALEVETEVVGDHEELVRGRELDVAPRVGEELRELGLFGVETCTTRR